MPSPSSSNRHHHHNHLLLILSALFLISSKSAIGAEHRIKTPAEFTDFVNSVNTNGESYNGTTVYLDSDLSLSGVTDPIGKDKSCFFRGVFDGQGHTISNLNINSSTEYACLFGYSTGLTIRNVVLDESCSILGSFIDSSSDAYTCVSGFIGHCTASTGSCTIENNVNMGSVTFDGLNDQLRLGGIAGQLESSVSYTTYVRNCVNYGPLTHPGTNNYCSNLGGIVGTLGDTKYYKYIQNCANYGAITHSGTTSYALRIAGIVGYSRYGYIENCLSAGKISLSNEPPSIEKGSIVGCASSPTNISYCYFTDDVGINELYSDGSPIMTNTPNSASTINSALLNSLNTQATTKGWNKWVSLHLNGGMVNSLTQDTLAVTGKPFPDPVKEGDTFIHWCKDENCNSVYDPQADDISGITDLYAHWTKVYTLTFVFNNGAENEVRTLYLNEAIVYPADPTKEGNTFNGWSPKPATMPAENITVTAQWTPNNYTLTFNATGGVPSQQSKNVTYGEEYGDLPSAGEKTGHNFDGWYTEADGGVQVTSETIVTTANDHTLYAHWTPNKYTLGFILCDGSFTSSEHNFSAAVEYPKDTQRDGYTFSEWDKTITTMPASNTNVTAVCTTNSYNVTFVFENGEEDRVESVLYKERIPYPEDPVKEGHTFNGWSETIEFMPAGDVAVTAQWTPNKYTITFNATGGVLSQQSKKVTYGEEYGDLPSAGEKTGHTFDGWFTEADGGVQVTSQTTVTTANDHTLYAQWIPKVYTVTFVFNNGVENDVKTLSYNEAIVYPADPTKGGHTFNGWSPKPATMPAENMTVTAQWIEKPSEYVEIVFGKKDLKEEDVREILQAYTQEEFVIEKIEEDEETGEVRVIVKFVDQTKAAEFVRNINENDESEENFVKRANVVSDHDSFSFPLSPLSFLSLFFDGVIIILKTVYS